MGKLFYARSSSGMTRFIRRLSSNQQGLALFSAEYAQMIYSSEVIVVSDVRIRGPWLITRRRKTGST